jgi:hypothetical protein
MTKGIVSYVSVEAKQRKEAGAVKTRRSPAPDCESRGTCKITKEKRSGKK